MDPSNPGAEALSVLDRLLARVVELDGSDLFLAVGASPMAGVHGEVRPLSQKVVPAALLDDLLLPLLGADRAARFAEQPDADVAYALSGVGRFRVNLYRQRAGLGLVARRVKMEVPTLAGLRLPDAVAPMALLHHGLVLVVGATGSGKSTTLAAMIDHRNEKTASHIVTIEDPVEFVHPNKRSLVTQREIGTDTRSFADAVRSLLRQAPSMILLGEIRDRETAEVALRLAETGHLVTATLHATNATHAVERLVGLYPEGTREQVLMQLSLELGGIVAQRLLPRRDREGRVAAIEVLPPTPRVRDLIGRGEYDALAACMTEANGADGIQTFEDALTGLVFRCEVTADTAIAHADSPSNLRLRLQREAERRGHVEPQDLGLKLV